MKTTTKILAITSLMVTSGIASAIPSTTILSQQSIWDYNVTANDISSNITTFASYDYSTFTANYTGALTGQAGFGNTTPPAGGATNTVWTANTDLALQTTFELAGTVIGDVTLNLATDNGAIVFINGTEVFSDIQGGYTYIWEYSSSISGSLFNAGLNTISVLTEDHGGATFFDMELVAREGITESVPEPTTLALLSAGLLGLGLSRRRQS